jgi:hypothetical protein
MPLYVQNGKLIQKAGALGTSTGCCCRTTTTICILQQSGNVSGITGSDVVFNGGGGTYTTLNYFSVNGYWLGRFEGVTGYTQSVTITFTTVKPSKATLRCSALSNNIGSREEKLNYSFTGATAVAFTSISGAGLTDNGSTVSRAAYPTGAGDSLFRIIATGEISQIFFEGEMINKGDNGVVVEICVEI